MKVKTSDLIGPALDWSVAMCEGASNLRRNPHRFNNAWIVDWPGEDSAPTTDYLSCFDPSSDWNLGGPIIEREGIGTVPEPRDHSVWKAQFSYTREVFRMSPIGLVNSYCLQRGPTPLVAAMRCYVTSKLGDEVEIPDELINAQG